MKSKILFMISTLAVLALVVPAAQGELITDVSASASSYLPDKINPERENPIKVVNGAGLTYPEHTNNKLLPEGEPDYGSFWHTGTLDRYTHDGAWFLIDLKQDYELNPDTTLKIWNYNSTEPGSWMAGLNRGMRAVEFSYLADDGGPVLSVSGGANGVLPSGTFTTVSAKIFDHTGTEVQVLTKATGLDTYSEYDTVAFDTSVTARYIKMTVMGGTGVGNYGDANFTGLSEVQVFAVPEPTIIVLLSSVFATVLLALCYRKR